MTPFRFMLVIGALSLAFIACSGGDGSDEAAPTFTDGTLPPSTAAAATASPERASSPSPSTTLEDPREFVFFVTEQMRRGDWETARPLLVDDFQSFGDEVLERSVRLAPPDTLDSEFDKWSVEEHERFTIVRLTRLPFVAYVLRDAGDGWRLDPGPHVLARARMYQEYPETSGWQSPDAYQRRQTTEPGDPPVPSLVVFSESLEAIVLADNGVDLAFRWELARQAEAELPLDQLWWEAEGERGSVELVWTTAEVSDGRLILSQPPEKTGLLHYDVAFTLVSVPEVEQVTLHVNGLEVDLPEEDPFTISAVHTIPIRPHPLPEQVVNPPESATLAPTGEAPGGEAEPPGFEIVDMGLNRESERTDVDIELTRPVEERIDVVGDPTILWSDGETTAGQQRSDVTIHISTTRQDVADDVVPTAVIFPAIVRSLPADAEAVVGETVIQTKWGEFELDTFTERPGGEWSTSYKPIQQRWIDSVVVATSEGEIGAHGSLTSVSADYTEVRGARLVFGHNFDDVRTELPLIGTVRVREAVYDVQVELPPVSGQG